MNQSTPVVMKRLYELCIMIGLKKLDFVTEIAIAESRNLRGNDDEEHWSFGTADNTIQMQGVNCCTCGNFKFISHINRTIPDKIACECSCYATNYNKDLITKMQIYERMEEFIGIVNPEGGKDRLCEDVVGDIFAYLHPVI
jgi:hypothetical protein